MRDIVLITAPNSSGKTTAYNVLASEALQYGYVEKDKKPTSDFHAIIEAIKIDDRETGGKNHFHEGASHPHSNTYLEDTFDFIVTGNIIIQNMYRIWGEALAALPQEEREIHFAELAGGINLSRYSEIDHSYARVIRIFKDAIIPLKVLERILAVVYIRADWKTRSILNTQHSMPLPQEVMEGKASALKPSEVLLKFGRSDFIVSGMQKFLEEHSIQVHILKNEVGIERKSHYQEQLKEVARTIFCSAS